MLSLKNVRDEDLLCQLSQLVKESRGVEAEVVARIGEADLRRLYAREACSSMFEYCRRVLGLRENEAYLRITVARAAREHPVLLEMLRDGRLHLSGIARLTPYLTGTNAPAVLERACGMSHRQIRELVAELEPRPDVTAGVRRLPQRPAASGPAETTLLDERLGSGILSGSASPSDNGSASGSQELGAPRVDMRRGGAGAECLRLATPGVVSDPGRLESRVAAPARPALVEPLAPGRYQVRFTTGAELREKLERLQALMRASVPDGDLGRIIDIAVSEKLQRIEGRRFGRTQSPREDPADTDTSPSSRHIPAAVRRRVYGRDGGRCAYRDGHGRRCDKWHDLEFHHKLPFARGGEHSVANLTLMCRAHNTLLAELDYGEDVMARFRAATSRASVPVDAYGARIAVQPRPLCSG